MSGWGGGQGGCEWRSEAFVKIGGGGVRSGWGGSVGGQGGCEWRSEGFVIIQKKKKKKYFFFFFFGGAGGPVRGVRVDGSGEVKLL